MSAAEVFCDYLNVTVPIDYLREAREGLRPVMDSVGAVVEADDRYRVDGGSLKHENRGRFGLISASGQVLASLRQFRLFDEYLRVLGSLPHKVTLLHATRDRVADGPAEVQGLYRRACRGGVSLTRKAIQPRQITKLFGPSVLDGRDTGSVYLGRRTSEVWAKVYDKREERLVKGFADPGPLVRDELCCGKVGATLRDAQAPEALFWHYMAPGVYRRPRGAPAWSPGVEGCSLAPRELLPPAQRLKRRVESSSEIRALLELANQAGPHGVDYFCSLLRRLGGRLRDGVQEDPPGGASPEAVCLGE